jgi:pyruvate kinase
MKEDNAQGRRGRPLTRWRQLVGVSTLGWNRIPSIPMTRTQQPSHRPPDPEERLRVALEELKSTLLNQERLQRERLDAVHPRYRSQARNLMHVLAFQSGDHGELQRALRRRGLSSLEGCEAHLLATLSAVLHQLHPQGRRRWAEPGEEPEPAAPDSPEPPGSAEPGLLGPGDGLATPAIMVTLPGAAAADAALIPELLSAGMTIARINAAHDDPSVWSQLVERVREASRASGRGCLVGFDLAGPKLRTGILPPLPGVVQGRPQRDRLGRLVRPFRMLLLPEGTAPAPWPAGDDWTVLPVRESRLEGLAPGDRLLGRDASGRLRELTVVEAGSRGLVVAGRQRCRFTEGLCFRQEGGEARFSVAALPEEPGERMVRVGDRLRLTATASDAADAIPCTLPSVFADLRPGERLLFDDGRIGAEIQTVSPREVGLKITAARPRGSRLRSDQGINIPDSTVHLPALTEKDHADLAFAVQHADLISYSFVRSVADIEALQAALHSLGRQELAVVLKIENRQAVHHLPELLLAAMRWPAPLGVMIARGDLAIECGWEELASIQERILRLCAAARIPCIWATQVLEEMAHHGTPTRAEITDAAMGARAEVLMLNKGPNITATVRTLQAIIDRVPRPFERPATAAVSQPLTPSAMEIAITSPCPESTIAEQGIRDWPVWTCPVSTFAWTYGEREICLLLEGEVTVIPQEGEPVRFGAGDLVTFPAGLRCTWEVHAPVRKHYRFG